MTDQTCSKVSETMFIAHYRESDGVSQSLWQHLLHCAELAGKFSGKVGLEEQGYLLGLLHDLGKATSEFSDYIKRANGLIDSEEGEVWDAEQKRGKIDHSSAGAQLVFRHLSGGASNRIAAQMLALIIASHHSGLIDCLTPDGRDYFSQRMQKSDTLTRMSEALQNLDSQLRKTVDELLADPVLVEGVNDAIRRLCEPEDETKTVLLKVGLLVRFLFSCLIDADRQDTADFERPNRVQLRTQRNDVSWATLCSRLEQHLATKLSVQTKIDLKRQEVSLQCLQFASRPKGVYQLTVPTGGGKTLSSLRFALHHAKYHDMDRIIYIIPYTSIIEQNADTVRKILEADGEENGSIVLENHSNLTPEKETSQQKVLAENWDAPVVFITMVQFLEALFGRGTRDARRMHQLANAVLIFDEIQTLPVRCVHLFNVAIRFLTNFCGSSVVLCTATQPLLHEVKPSSMALRLGKDQQMVPNSDELFEQLRRVKVYDRRKVGGWTVQEVAELAKKELHNTGSVLVVVNTKRSARQLYQELRDSQEASVYHLSTNMCPAHRLVVFEKVKEDLKYRHPVICVSTQLIEAGVDIDFGCVIRYIAGLDSIAQAAGRCNRNGAGERLGRVYIINPAQENLDKLKDIKIGKECAERVLREFAQNPEDFDHDLISPKAMNRYYLYYFYQRANEMSYSISKKSSAGRSDTLVNLLSSNPLSVEAYARINKEVRLKIPLTQSFMTAAREFAAIDTPTRGVIVPYGDEGREIISALAASCTWDEQHELLRRAQRYSVNVYENILNDLIRHGIVRQVQEKTDIWYLDERYYNKEYGLNDIKSGDMPTLLVGGAK